MIPVSSIWTLVSCSSREGAGRWIGYMVSEVSGPALSTGSPMMFMIRPRVFDPTGIMIGLPVSSTAVPRVRPSVEDMATVRTRLSPRCEATSRTRRSL